jgi:hypothetical protein
VPETPARDALETLEEILGCGVAAERLAANLVAYRDIAAAIRRLRELDLTDIHPAVVFDPAAPFAAEDPAAPFAVEET